MNFQMKFLNAVLAKIPNLLKCSRGCLKQFMRNTRTVRVYSAHAKDTMILLNVISLNFIVNSHPDWDWNVRYGREGYDVVYYTR